MASSAVPLALVAPLSQQLLRLLAEGEGEGEV
jgi:hypothetical protein